MVVSEEFIEANSWMVRPCKIYKEEYSDCTSVRSRFYQHFIFGKFSDCSQWNRDYKNCNKWIEDKDEKAFEELIESEQARRKERLAAHNNNDIWEKRTEPPASWNDPLPKHIEERLQYSYLSAKIKAEQEGTESSMCVIS